MTQHPSPEVTPEQQQINRTEHEIDRVIDNMTPGIVTFPGASPSDIPDFDVLHLPSPIHTHAIIDGSTGKIMYCSKENAEKLRDYVQSVGGMAAGFGGMENVAPNGATSQSLELINAVNMGLFGTTDSSKLWAMEQIRLENYAVLRDALKSDKHNRKKALAARLKYGRIIGDTEANKRLPFKERKDRDEKFASHLEKEMIRNRQLRHSKKKTKVRRRPN